jgi:multidrug efflux pump subunit AcrB
VFTRIGRQAAVVGMDEQHSGLNTAMLEVRLHEGERSRAVLERLRPQLGALPAGSVSLETGQAAALGRLLGAGEADLAVRIRGENMDAAMTYAGVIARELVTVPELTNVRVGTELGQPEYIIEVDRERAAAYGIEPGSIVSAIDGAMRGRTSQNPFVAFDRKVPIIVRLPESERRSLATLETLRVRGVPVRELVRVREAVGPVEIQRLDQSRFVPVYADAVGRDLDRAVAAVNAAVLQRPPPPGLRHEIGGENEEMRRSFRELGFAFALALLLVYMILAAQFESLVHPFTVLLSVPLGLIGAVFALWLSGAGLNTVSLIGIVVLIGIVDNDAVVKIDLINQLRREGTPLREAIIEAGRARLRPIVMNSITTMLAITPMMMGFGQGAALQAPLAIAIFGGLFTSTVLTLIVIPVIYELLDEAPARLFARVHRRCPCGGAARSADCRRQRRRAAHGPRRRGARRVIRTFVQRPIAVSMIYLTVAALGVAAFRNIPIELLPDTSLPRLNVSRAGWVVAGSSGGVPDRAPRVRHPAGPRRGAHRVDVARGVRLRRSRVRPRDRHGLRAPGAVRTSRLTGIRAAHRFATARRADVRA